MKLFVTGGNGRMGRELIPQLEGLGWEIFAPRSFELDITDERALAAAFERFNPDITLHLAAYTNVAQAELERERCWRANVLGTRLVARHALGRFVHFSSDYVFDGERGDYREDEAPNPSNFYSLSKVVAEEAARQARTPLIVRTSFKESAWPYPMAFADQFTSADFVDVIASEVHLLLQNLALVDVDLLHVVTERKSIFELASRRNPGIQAGSRAQAKVHIPPDVSLNTERWQTLKVKFTATQTPVRV